MAFEPELFPSGQREALQHLVLSIYVLPPPLNYSFLVLVLGALICRYFYNLVRIPGIVASRAASQPSTTIGRRGANRASLITQSCQEMSCLRTPLPPSLLSAMVPGQCTGGKQQAQSQHSRVISVLSTNFTHVNAPFRRLSTMVRVSQYHQRNKRPMSEPTNGPENPTSADASKPCPQPRLNKLSDSVTTTLVLPPSSPKHFVRAQHAMLGRISAILVHVSD